MKKYTVFEIPKKGKHKDFPLTQRIVIKRYRGEHTNEKLGDRGYKHLGIVDARTKGEARKKGNALAMGFKK